MKAGYPPYPLTLVPELPIDSLGLKNGEQLVVTQRHGAGSQQAFRAPPTSPFPPPSPVAAMTGMTASQVREPPRSAAVRSPPKGPDHVLTSNGYLMHRVSGLIQMGVCTPRRGKHGAKRAWGI